MAASRLGEIAVTGGPLPRNAADHAIDDLDSQIPERGYADAYSEDSLRKKLGRFAIKAGRECIRSVLILYYCL